MKYYDLNASSFAEKIQVGRSSISHILSGRNKPSLDFVINIVNTFPEVDLYWLLNGTGTFPKNNSTNTTPVTDINTHLPKTEKAENNSTTPVEKETVTNLFSDQNIASSQKNDSKFIGKKVTKIIVLYSDGTFKDYLPE